MPAGYPGPCPCTCTPVRRPRALGSAPSIMPQFCKTPLSPGQGRELSILSHCDTPCGPRREMYLNLCAVSAHALSCRFFLALQHASRVTALGRGFLTGGSSRLSVPLRRLCSIKTLHRVPRLAARPCESYCTIASRPVHHARLRSTPALDLAPRGLSSGRPSQAKLPMDRLSATKFPR
jgi:hypothetical protein